MDKILYIHVGTPKTGTSAIQQFCVYNQETFEKRGYCYPLMPYEYKNKSKFRNAHFLIGRVLDDNKKRDKEEEKARFQGGMEIVKELFATHKAVVLSDESIYRATSRFCPQLWEELKKVGEEVGFKIVIIVYLRRQDEYLTSVWSQGIKAGYIKDAAMTWDDWYAKEKEKRDIDYKAKVDEYINAVGRENVVIRKYDRDGFFGGNIFADFLQAIDLKLEDDFIMPPKERNPGLKGNTNEIRRIINTIPNISASDHSFLKNALLGFSDISVKEYPSSVMSPKEREELMDFCAQGNREVARLIYGEERELYEKDASNTPKWEKDNPYMLDDVIRLVAMTTIQLREENQKQAERIKRLEERIKRAESRVIQLENDLRIPFTYYPKKLKRKISRKAEEKSTKTDNK